MVRVQPGGSRLSGPTCEEQHRGGGYVPGLDGLRAIAVAAVIAYHLGIGLTPGGLLGVGVFFTLSGYLITDLLLTRWSTGVHGFGDFWLRRARRLLPGLFLMVAVVVVWVALADHPQFGVVRGQAFAAGVYVSNWWQIFQHITYFSRFGSLSPLNHLWSLAVEEQFYLLWPALLLLGIRFVREPGRTSGTRPRLALLTLALAVVSAVEMALLYHPSLDSTRIYDGTDTRAFGLLFGAALAMVWPRHLLRTPIRPAARRTLDRAGYLGLATIAILIWRTNQYSPFLYHGGLVLLSLATVLVIAAVVHPAGVLGARLGAEPLRWIGERSYGIYLWHVPIILLSSPARAHGFDAARALLQVGLTVVVADLSWRFVEAPIRAGKLRAVLGQARAGWHLTPLRIRFRLIGTGGLGATALALMVFGHSAAQTPAAADIRSASTTPPGTRARAQTVAFVSGRPYTTSCRQVVHIGDSTSESLMSPDYLPRPADRIDMQYAGVGVASTQFEIQGGTSILETIGGQPNAYDAATTIKRRGYRGCWVIALGTNDSADVYVGSSMGVSARIAHLMSAIGNDPVMWVNVKSLVTGGPYSESDMAKWNSALVQNCSRYPNMRVFDWASIVEDNWFTTDGIHFTSTGSRARARAIADALAFAFPHGGRSPNCIVSAVAPAPAA